MELQTGAGGATTHGSPEENRSPHLIPGLCFGQTSADGHGVETGAASAQH